MNIYEINKKLIGPISPQGESNGDNQRLLNLEETIELTEKLIDDIINISKYRDRYEASVKAIGLRGQQFIDELKEKIETLSI